MAEEKRRMSLRENKIMWEGTEIETEGVEDEKKGGGVIDVPIYYLFILFTFLFLSSLWHKPERNEWPTQEKKRQKARAVYKTLPLLESF